MYIPLKTNGSSKRAVAKVNRIKVENRGFMGAEALTNENKPIKP